FQYKLYDSNREAYADIDHDIFFGIPYHYASNGMVLSKPFLKTETILYINSSLDSSQLDDKIYAAVRGRVPPEGINEENMVCFDRREESLDAVERGKPTMDMETYIPWHFIRCKIIIKVLLWFLKERN
ncbi:MAG: hypothetical protein QM295_00750, partial [Bacillota bacterium]|nr:hypothetical protein [Bacillota bacterium]